MLHKKLNTRGQIYSIVFVIFVLVNMLSSAKGLSKYLLQARWVVLFMIFLCGIFNVHKFKKNVTSKFSLFLLLFLNILEGLLTSFNKEFFLTGVERSLSFLMLTIGLILFFSNTSPNEFTPFDGLILFGNLLEILNLYFFISFFFSHQGFGQYRSFYANKNYLYPICLASFIYSIILAFLSRSKYKVIFNLSLSFICAFLVLATGSRAGFLCLFISIFLLPFALFKKESNIYLDKRIVLIVIFVILTVFIIAIFKIPAFKRLFYNDDSSSTGFLRESTWGKGLRILMIKPIFGWGNSATYYNVFVNNSSGIEGWGVHNSFLMYAIDYGFFGLFCLALFFATYFTKIVKTLKIIKFEKWRKVFFMLFVLILVFLISSFAESFLFSVGNFASVIFWLSFIFVLFLSDDKKMGGEYHVL